jgi:carboxylesterase
VLIVHAKNDKLAAPSGAQHIFDHLASKEKRLIWLEKSGHEVLLDNEVDQVLQHIFTFKFFN